MDEFVTMLFIVEIVVRCLDRSACSLERVTASGLPADGYYA